MKVYTIILFILSCANLSAQNYWEQVEYNKPEKEIHYNLDIDNFKKSLDNGEALIPIEKNLKAFKIFKTSNFEDSLASKYPKIKSYIGFQANNPQTKVFISSSPKGISASIINAENFISLKKNSIGLYSSEKLNRNKTINCLTEFSKHEIPLYAITNVNDQVLRTFKIAISVNGEYTQYFGGTKQDALAAINETLSNINALYQSELAVRFILVNDNDKLIFIDPATDPYSDASSGSTGSWLDQVQSTITNNIGESNYDIGHLLSAEGGVGLSGCIGCIGEDGKKGRAFTAAAADDKPAGPRFDIDFLAHEIGHQLGANHTFSYYEGVETNFEPGSGTTIMGYAGLEGYPIDAQANSDDYFHAVSISQITENLKNKNVGSVAPINNVPPSVEAGMDYTIPAGTPFKLTGIASDPDSNQLLYNWEQADGSTLREFHFAKPYESTGALFRSYPPNRQITRYFPSMDLILEGRLNDNFESLPQVNRTMNFYFTARDNETIGQNNSDQMKVYVKKENKSFSIIPSDTTSIKPNSKFELKWNVANTNASPYNVSNVNILWSLNGGDSFETLAANQPNNGSYKFTLPNGIIAKDVYFMVEAIDNIFFAVSEKFSLGYSKDEVCEKYHFNNLPLSIPDGKGAETFGVPAESVVAVNNNSKIENIKLNIGIEHDYIGDLRIQLIHPNGYNVTLYNQQCENQTLINATFKDNANNIDCNNINSNGIRPAQRLDKLKEFSPIGAWRLLVFDGNKLDTGKINSASLEICNANYQKLNLNDVKEDAISIYPNPTNDSINFTGLTDTKITYFIYNSVGQLIMNGITNNKYLFVKRLEEGVYFLVVQQDGNTHYFKMMKN